MYQVDPIFQRTANIPQKSSKIEDHQEEPMYNHSKSNWEWYNPPEDSIPASFCTDSSLHGLKYIGQYKRHILERLFWLVAFTASVVTAVYFIISMWTNYWNNPTITVFNPTETTIDEIPFPGLTICNVNSLRKTSFDKQTGKVALGGLIEAGKHLMGANISNQILKDLATLLDMSHICESTLSFTDRFIGNASILEWLESAKGLIMNHIGQIENMIDPISTLRKVSQPCSKMISHCVWLEEITDCNELFHEVETDYGQCCSFNTLPASLLLKQFDDKRIKPSVLKKWRDANLNYENLMFTEETRNRSVPYRQRYPGRSAGLSFLLDPDLEEYFCTNTDSKGFILGVNVPLDFPRMKDNGIAIQTESEIFIGLKPDVTMSHDSIKDFPVGRRKCYFGNERKLDHYSTYTTSNCMDECITRRTLKDCGCTRYYMPHDVSLNDQLCKPNMYNCTDMVRKSIIKFGISQLCSECLPTCTEIDYQKEVTFLRLQEKKINDLYKALPEKSTSKTYIDRKVSIVHVYFSKDSVHPKLRKEMTTVPELMSNAGGLLGLCLGFSVLSLLEILYYLTLRLCCSSYRKKSMRDRDQRKITTGENTIHQFDSSEESIHPSQGGWLPELFNRNSDISNIENQKRILFIKKRMKEQQQQFDGYEQDYNTFMGQNEYDQEISRGRSEEKTFHVPGSFEDQLYRAFLATTFPDKRAFQTLAK